MLQENIACMFNRDFQISHYTNFKTVHKPFYRHHFKLDEAKITERFQFLTVSQQGH